MIIARKPLYLKKLVDEWVARIQNNPELIEQFIDAIQGDNNLIVGTHFSAFRAVEHILGVKEGSIDFENITSEEIIQLIKSSPYDR